MNLHHVIFRSRLLFLLTPLLLAATPDALAHEMYVLDNEEINQALAAPIWDFATAVQENLGQFVAAGLVTLVVVVMVFFLSISKPIELFVDPLLFRIKRYAPTITQITLGLALLASGWNGAAFGIEMPFSEAFGSYAFLMQVIFILLGAAMLGGLYPRLAGVVAIVVFIPLLFTYGVYMLNYGIYFGEALTMALFGGGYTLLTIRPWSFERRILAHVYKYKFLLVRLSFGVSLLYAAVYAKYIHGALALETVAKYHLTQGLPFEPTFFVLGALIIEVLLGLFFLVGFEIRFASIFFLIFLILSVGYFGEAVWPHIVLVGTALAMFTHGYDKYTLTALISKRKDLEPVLSLDGR